MSISFDPHTPKELAYAVEISCNFPGCRCKAINSHLLQRSKFVKSIAENGLVLQMADKQLQPLIDGDEDGNLFMLLSTKDAMSLPIFCNAKGHDRKLFRRLEIQDIDLDSNDTYLRLSYRAYCAARAQEQRRAIYYDINPTINTFCQGELFNQQREYSHFILDAMSKGIARCYDCMRKKKYEDHKFHRFTIWKRIPVCMSDCVFVEEELIRCFDDNYPLAPMFVHALPYNDKTEVIIGYETVHKTDFIDGVLKDWTISDNYETLLLDLMAFSNNWCVSPSLFGNNNEERNKFCEYILDKKMSFFLR